MKPFFDTNILVYAQEQGTKGDRARTIMAAGGVISVQVLNEFASVCTRKLRLSWSAIDEAIDDVLATTETPVPLTLETHLAAIAIARRHHVSFYDALIIAAAIEAGCETLYTEDVQGGRVIDGLRIVDPFRAIGS